MEHSTRLTIREIAKEAGVSTQTVSRVINDRPDVADKTRTRVQEIIDRTGYYPSPHARGLTLTQNKIIGVITSSPSEYGPAQSLAGMDREAEKHGYSLSMIFLHNENKIMPAIRKMRAENVAGLIWSVTGLINMDFDQIAAELQKLPFPTLINTSAQHPDLKSIYIDNLVGSEMAVNHLIESGYQKIGIITGPLIEQAGNKRFQGWRIALQKAGRPVDETLVAHGNWNPQSGFEATQALMANHPDLDAIFCSNDEMAIGAMRAIFLAGKTIPNDIGLVGYDDMPTSEYLSPPLTTIRQDLHGSSRIAIEELIGMIENGSDFSEPATRLINLTPEIVVRDSTVRK